MAGVDTFFNFTSTQTKFLIGLTITLLIMGGYLIVRSYADPAPDADPLPVLLSDGDHQFVGTFVVDPNISPADSLELLPGIGKVLADRIVAYRQHHRFETEIDVTKVNGIGPVTFEHIRPYLKVQR